MRDQNRYNEDSLLPFIDPTAWNMKIIVLRVLAFDWLPWLREPELATMFIM
jgi:hypothetical protein